MKIKVYQIFIVVIIIITLFIGFIILRKSINTKQVLDNKDDTSLVSTDRDKDDVKTVKNLKR